MKTQFIKFSSTILFVLLISTSILSAESANHEHKQKTKLFMGINYENYRTSFYSKENFNTIIDSTISTVNEGIPRFHIRLNLPFEDSKLFKNFIVDMMIPFGTKEQDYNIHTLDPTLHKKFNVFELDIGIEFEL